MLAGAEKQGGREQTRTEGRKDGGSKGEEGEQKE